MTDYLSAPQVAAKLGMSSGFVRAELRRKNMRGSYIGGTWRVTEADVKAYIEAHANVPAVRRRSA